MNEPEPIKPCQNYPICAALFVRIDEKLALVHADVIAVRDENIRLNAKVTNGITSDIATMKERMDSHRVLLYSLWGLIGGVVTAALIYLVIRK
jgi:hypothetical protein